MQDFKENPMRKITALAAAAAAAFAVGNANALVFIVDTFDSPDMTLFDTTVGGGGVSVSGGPVNPPANTLSRTVTHELLAGSNVGGLASNVTIGTASEPTGSLNVNNGSSRDSQVTVSWALGAGFITDSSGPAASVRFDLIKSDLNAASFELFWNNVSFGSQVFPAFNGPGTTPILFALTAAQQDAIANNAGTLKLVIDGIPDFDLAIDAIGIQIPEPATLALAGLALLGAGVASRRRRA
jgi:hypothetical protein